MLNNRFSYVKRMSSVKKMTVLTASICALLISSGCEVMPKEPPPMSPPAQSTPKVDYTTVPVTRKTINNDVKDLKGKFVCTSTTDVMYTYSGMKLKEIKVKQGDIVNAGDILLVSDTTDLQDTIKQKELNLQKQKLDYAQKQLNNSDGYDLMKLQLDINATDEDLKVLYKNLEQATLTAPVSGQVSLVEALKEGDAIEAKKVLVTIADTSQLFFECTETDQNRIGKLALGMPAMLYYNNKNYDAEIVSTPRDNVTTGDAKIRLKVKDFNEGAKAIEQTGSFNVTLEKKENVLVTKSSYLLPNTSGDTNTYVNVLENGVKTKRLIQVGIRGTGSTADVEVVDGLKEGELVIVNK